MRVDTISISIPIPALKTVNSYIIESGDYVILIDLGMHVIESIETLEDSLMKYGYSPTDISYAVITHLHIDHIGGAKYFQSKYGLRIAMHENEVKVIRYVTTDVIRKAKRFQSILIKHGVPREDAYNITRLMPGFSYHEVYSGIKFDMLLTDKSRLKLGDEELIVIETPGHSPHHICLYNETGKELFTGDHVLPNITPNIRFPMDNEDSLGEYLDSLNRIRNIEVRKYYPAHGKPSLNIYGRIRELKCHHLERLLEVLNILDNNDLTLYDITKNMSWDVKLPWEDFPVVQKYFAIGEALAHVTYLKYRNMVVEKEFNNKIFYRKADGVSASIDKMMSSICS